MLIAFPIIHGANLRRTERQAFRWVQKYIGAFGGDSSKVTMYVSFPMSNRTIRHSHRIGSWGESSGAISAGLQLLANGGDTEGLFHGAFLQSGSIIPYGDTRKGQRWYDSLIQQSGCGSSNDTLVCLRSTVPDEVIDAVVAHLPTPVSLEVS